MSPAVVTFSWNGLFFRELPITLFEASMPNKLLVIDASVPNRVERSIQLSVDVYSQNQNCSKRFAELWLVVMAVRWWYPFALLS